MTDISKCVGHGCPLKEKCYRYTSPSGLDTQPHILPPFVIDKGLFKCSMYWGSNIDLLFKQLTEIVNK